MARLSWQSQEREFSGQSKAVKWDWKFACLLITDDAHVQYKISFQQTAWTILEEGTVIRISEYFRSYQKNQSVGSSSYWSSEGRANEALYAYII